MLMLHFLLYLTDDHVCMTAFRAQYMFVIPLLNHVRMVHTLINFMTADYVIVVMPYLCNSFGHLIMFVWFIH